MNGKIFRNFWIGFVAAAAAVLWVYWLKQQERELSPPPMVIGRQEAEPIEWAASMDEVKEDKLERIRGIGPVFAGRLRGAGIMTFAQLAGHTAGELQEITGATSHDQDEWIAEARGLALSG